ncbi:MAG: D-alanine-D-alanine ligase [Acidobacteriota bacterium]|nr:D-alanine-D-alanine ligase [Acidobacteriota bacterium]
MAIRHGNPQHLLSRLTVAVLVDRQVLVPGTSRFRAGEGHRPLVNTLRRVVEKVVIRPYMNVAGLFEFIKDVKPDVVFNLTEHADWDRTKDSHICALLDLLKLPYTGTGPRGMMLCRDKAVSKQIAAREGFKTPEFFVIEASEPRLPTQVIFPLVVKPRFSDGSDGISQASFVRTKEALLRRIAFLQENDIEEIICEEFIAGREMLVGVIGERVMPVREFFIGQGSKSAPRLVSYRLKHDKVYRRRWSLRTDFAQLTPEQERKVKELTLRTCSALDLRDYSRLDLKLTPTGEWVFLEANPNPGLSPFKRSLAGIWSDIDYEKLVLEILLRALQRED